ncbi:hypothetical protein GCM10022206_31210 [Streptomyces chiangmaiensis]
MPRPGVAVYWRPARRRVGGLQWLWPDGVVCRGVAGLHGTGQTYTVIPPADAETWSHWTGLPWIGLSQRAQIFIAGPPA